MPQVTLLNETDEDGEPIAFEVVGDWPSYDAVVEAHGFNPSTTDYEVDGPEADLSTAIQNASNLQELKDSIDPHSGTSPGASANKGNK